MSDEDVNERVRLVTLDIVEAALRRARDPLDGDEQAVVMSSLIGAVVLLSRRFRPDLDQCACAALIELFAGTAGAVELAREVYSFMVTALAESGDPEATAVLARARASARDAAPIVRRAPATAHARHRFVRRK